MTINFECGKMPTRQEILAHARANGIQLEDTIAELRLLDICYALWTTGYKSGIVAISEGLDKKGLQST